ncbi:MAG: 50S ribosomal protein L3 [Candidatus Pacebacteria bacterium]|nr:50S ribosomal protein L3 [Candidatus Paceibacterota bacterium]
MTQIFKENDVLPITIIKLDKKEDLDSFKETDLVTVTGTTKGHGFQGVVKRWSFAGGPQTHGQKNRLRAPGSISATAPQRVPPGRKMAGRMGGAQKTIKNLRIANINKEGGELSLIGSVPGTRGGKVTMKINK